MMSTMIETKHHYTADEAIGITVNHLMFLNRTTRKSLGEALGITGPAMGKKLRGESGWSVTDLFGVAEYFQVPVADLLPRKVNATQETPDSFSRTEGSGLVAGAGFEPTTSGL